MDTKQLAELRKAVEWLKKEVRDLEKALRERGLTEEPIEPDPKSEMN